MELFPPKVKLNEINHTYTDNSGQRYMGYSEFSDHFICKAFDATFIAGKVAQSEGTTRQVVLDNWQSKTDNGSYYDKALQECVDPINYEKYPDIRDLVAEMLSEYAHHKKTYEQLIVFSEHYRIAGAIDKLGLMTTRADGLVDISDYKCYEKPNEFFLNRGWLLGPLSHLPNSKYIKTALQLSFYALQVELLTERKIRALFIHIIDPINKTHKKVYTPYLRTDILMLLEINRNKILSLVEKQESIF